MSRIEPPRLPTWMLEHLKIPGSNVGLDGDLIEEFRSGRSKTWYWSQVLAAVVIGWLKNIRNHRNLIVFSCFWSIFAPGWILLAMKLVEERAAAWHIWQFNWPWSDICSIGLFFVPGLIFIWLGSVLYFLISGTLRCSGLWPVGRGLLFSVPVFIFVSGALAGSIALFQRVGLVNDQHQSALSIAPASPYFTPKAVGGGREVTVTKDKHGAMIVRSTSRIYIAPPNSPWAPKPFQLGSAASGSNGSSPWDAVTETGVWPIINRLPFFMSMLLVLWSARRARKARNQGPAIKFPEGTPESSPG